MTEKKRIVIVGGGYTGAATAIHLSRAATIPLDIAVVEPRDEVGRGVAYSATDPDHRINAPSPIHYLYPEDPDGLVNWLHATGRFAQDPDIEAFDGSMFPRRAELGGYVHAEFVAHQASNPSGSDLRHIQGRATALDKTGTRFRIAVEAGGDLAADLVVIATGNENPGIPSPFPETLRAHPGFFPDPWDLKRLAKIGSDAIVLILGAGLTAADVAATLLRDGPPASIDVISRTGIRPTSRPASHANLPEPIWDRVSRRPSLFVRKHGAQNSVRGIFRHLRQDIAAKAADGMPWQTAFDDVRDSLRHLWTNLPLEEKRRFGRHLRRLYDSCRFRYPPQTKEILDAAEAAGQLRFRIGRVTGVTGGDGPIEVHWADRATGGSRTRSYDCIVNCVGLPSRPDRSGNAFLGAAVAGGHLRAAPLGIGLDVDQDCRAIAAGGTADPGLYALGPLTFAQFGDPLGVPFIIYQVIHAVPGMLAAVTGER